jgi:hypothetical protein
MLDKLIFAQLVKILSVSIEHEFNGRIRKVSLLVSVKNHKDHVHFNTVLITLIIQVVEL